LFLDRNRPRQVFVGDWPDSTRLRSEHPKAHIVPIPARGGGVESRPGGVVSLRGVAAAMSEPISGSLVAPKLADVAAVGVGNGLVVEAGLGHANMDIIARCPRL